MRKLTSHGFLGFIRMQIVAVVVCAVMAIPAVAQFSSLVSFNGTNGNHPGYGALVQGRDGDYYGTTSGTVFKVASTGVVSVLHTFCSQPNCGDGNNAIDGLVLGTDGNFYGTTYEGGDTNSCNYPYGCGTVFKITSAGKLTTLYTFQASGGQGAGPQGGLVQGSNGNFYGITGSMGGDGTVFEITPAGTLTTLHFFSLPDGTLPGYGGLALGIDGNFYGTTAGGGTSPNCNGCGTVFKITPTGTLTTLHTFSLTDGAAPLGGLVQAANGKLLRDHHCRRS